MQSLSAFAKYPLLIKQKSSFEYAINQLESLTIKSFKKIEDSEPNPAISKYVIGK